MRATPEVVKYLAPTKILVKIAQLAQQNHKRLIIDEAWETRLGE